MSDVHDQALHLLVQPQVGVFLSPEARETVLRALEEVETLRKDRDMWKRTTEETAARLGELRQRFDMIIGLAAIDKPEGSPAPALSEDSPPCAETSPKAGQEAGDVVLDLSTAAGGAERLLTPQNPAAVETLPTCAGWNKSANVVCGTKSVHVEHEGKWFCNRHAPDRKTRLEAAGA